MPKSLNLNQSYRMKKFISLLKQDRYPNASSFADLLRRELEEANLNIPVTDAGRRDNYDRAAFKIIKQHVPVTETYLANFTTKRENRFSVRTIIRDIKMLKKIYVAPIVFDRQKNGYKLTDPDYSPEIPSFSKSDMSATVIALRNLKSIMPEGTQIRERLNETINDVSAENPMASASASPESFMIFSATEAIDREIFDEVYLAWNTCTTLTLSYGKDEITESKFEPHVIAYKEGKYFVSGKLFVKDSCEVKTLNLADITEAIGDGDRFTQDTMLIDETAILMKFLQFDQRATVSSI